MGRVQRERAKKRVAFEQAAAAGAPEISATLMMMLKHTVAAEHHRSPGFRNHYCTSNGSPADERCQSLVELGLMKGGQTLNGGQSRYYHATVAGCVAAGLTLDQTFRAFDLD